MRYVLSCGLRVSIVFGLASVVGHCAAESALAQGGGAFGGSFDNSSGVDQPADKAQQDPPEIKIQRGRELFSKRWKQADPGTPYGDGLGPVYNAQSCAECHGLVRPGGAGSNDHNVELLTVTPPEFVKPIDRRRFAGRMAAIDSALTAGFTSVRPSVTLHKLGTDPYYDEWRLRVYKLATGKDAVVAPGQTAKQPLSLEGRIGSLAVKGLHKSDLQHLGIAQRSTPALFGAGLIDAIRDDVLSETAKAQSNRHDSIKGQVGAAIGGAGKFGWRGQTANLKEFVMGACANELGLQVPAHDQGINPLNPSYRPRGIDLTQSQCDDLAAFVASLPRPAQREPSSTAERQIWDAGEQAFNSIGCANCHVRKLDSVDGLYSDLLLHDLGPKLSDPAGASPSSGGASPAYYGGPADVFVEVAPITRRQWRTPPLWGVADSAPYLHDGRAATLHEAIDAHEGEALATAKRYFALPSIERAKLLAFLNSLAAPREAALVAQQ